jgi:hypothetical protein
MKGNAFFGKLTQSSRLKGVYSTKKIFYPLGFLLV